MRGVVIPVSQKYETIALASLQKMRTDFGVDLPVEIWEVGREISEACRAELAGLGETIFRNVSDHIADWQAWKGFQVKAFAARFTQFEEFLLCDADVTFLRDPRLVFSNARYLRTGAFFFRDMHYWKFENLGMASTNKLSSLPFFLGRRQWLRRILPERPRMFPREWRYIYSEENPRRPVPEAYMEAGALYFDRSRHMDTLDAVFRLNENHEETYRYVWGDKETWWIACCMCNKEFAMNLRYPTQKPKLTQFYGLRPFYVQK